MRIAIASSGLGHVQRGIEAWARSLAEMLHARGEDVVLYHGGGEYGVPDRRLPFRKRGDRLTRAWEDGVLE
jgi:hypothetical protein